MWKDVEMKRKTDIYVGNIQVSIVRFFPGLLYKV